MESQEKDTIDIKSLFVKYLRQWKLFLITFIFSIIPAVLYLSFYPRTYEVVAGIQLYEDKGSTSSSFGLGGEAGGLMKSFGLGSVGGSLNVEDEMAVLHSNRLFGQMVSELGLNVTYFKPFSFYKMYHNTPLRLTADSATMARLDDEYRFTVTVSPGHIRVKAKSWFGGSKVDCTFASLPAKIQIDGLVFVLDKNAKIDSSDESYKLKITCLPISWASEKMREDLDIEEESTGSNVLNISYSEHSKERGKDVLNVLVRKYNDDVKFYNDSEDNKTLAFVDQRIAKVLADLSEIERRIEDYKTKNNITLIEVDLKMYSEALLEIQTAISSVESQAHLFDMLDDYIKDPEHKYSTVPALLTTSGNGSVGSIYEFNAALIQREQLLRNSNETNPAFIEADNRVEMLRKSVYVMVDNAQKNNQQTLAELKRREKELFAKMKTVPEKEREYVEYVRNQEIVQGIYLMLLQKREEALLSLSKTTERARLVEPPYVKKKPLGPRKLYAAIGMLVFTLVVPIGIVLSKELYRSIKEEFVRTK